MDGNESPTQWAAATLASLWGADTIALAFSAWPRQGRQRRRCRYQGRRRQRLT